MQAQVAAITTSLSQRSAVDGAVVITLGSQLIGDQKDGVFRYDATSVALVDDITVYEGFQGKGRWIRLGLVGDISDIVGLVNSKLSALALLMEQVNDKIGTIADIEGRMNTIEDTMSGVLTDFGTLGTNFGNVLNQFGVVKGQFATLNTTVDSFNSRLLFLEGEIAGKEDDLGVGDSGTFLDNERVWRKINYADIVGTPSSSELPFKLSVLNEYDYLETLSVDRLSIAGMEFGLTVDDSDGKTVVGISGIYPLSFLAETRLLSATMQSIIGDPAQGLHIRPKSTINRGIYMSPMGNISINGSNVDYGIALYLSGDMEMESETGLTISSSWNNGAFGYKALNLRGTGTQNGASGGIAFLNGNPKGATPLTFNNNAGTTFQIWVGGTQELYAPNGTLFQYVVGDAQHRFYEAGRVFKIAGAGDNVNDFVYTPSTTTLKVGTLVAASYNTNAGLATFNPKLTASADNEGLVGVYINPTFVPNGKVNVQTYALKTSSSILVDNGSLYLSNGSLYATFIRANGGHLVFGNDNQDYGRWFGNGNFRVGGNYVDRGYKFDVLGTSFFDGEVIFNGKLNGNGNTILIRPTLPATANNQELIGVTISPDYQVGSYTGVDTKALKVDGTSLFTGMAVFSNGLIVANVYTDAVRSNGGPLQFGSGGFWGGFHANGNYRLGGSFSDRGYKLDVVGNSYFEGDVTTTGKYYGDGSALTGITAALPSNAVTTDTTQGISGQKNFSGYILFNRAFASSFGEARGVQVAPTFTAAANNLTFYGLDVMPTFNTGSYTGVTTYAARFGNDVLMQGHILVPSDNVYDIGSNLIRHRNIYGRVVTSNTFVANLVQTAILQSRSTTLSFRNLANTIYGTWQDTGNLRIGAGTADTGDKLYVEGNIVATGYSTASAVTTLLASNVNGSFIPTLNFEIGNLSTDANVSAENAMIIRQRSATNNTLTKRLSLLLKLSSESPSESVKMGGMLLESSQVYANAPDLFLVSSGEKRLRIGGSLVFGEIGVLSGRLTVDSGSGNQLFKLGDATFTKAVGSNFSFHAGPNDLLFTASGNKLLKLTSTGLNIELNGNIDPAGDASALVTMTSITRGFLPPRMTAAQRNAISNPATGLIAYITDSGTEGLSVRTSTGWITLGTGGSGAAANLPFTTVNNTAELRTAISNAGNYRTIYMMPGTYDLTTTLDIQGKTGLTIDGGNWGATITTSTLTENIVFRGNIKDVKLTGIRFTNTKTGSDTGYGMILVNEQGPVDGLIIDNCFFSNGTTKQNAISMHADNGNTTASFKNISVQRCTFRDVGRMALEITNHVWERSGATQTYSRGIYIKDNIFENLGLNNARYGMAVSVSGLNELVEIEHNKSLNAKFCHFELVGGRLVTISDNKAVDVAGNTAATGISVSNGYGRGSSTRVTIGDNNFDVSGRSFQIYDATWVTITGGTYFSVQLNDIRSNLVTMTGANIKVTNDMNALYMGHCKYCIITDNIMSTTGSTVQTYGVINCFYDSANPSNTENSTDNVITGNKLFRPGNAAQTVIEGSTTLNVIKDNT